MLEMKVMMRVKMVVMFEKNDENDEGKDDDSGLRHDVKKNLS